MSARFFTELKRRNVYRAAVFYAGAAWLQVQIATQVFPFFHIPEWVVRWIVIAAVVGFPFAMVFSCAAPTCFHMCKFPDLTKISGTFAAPSGHA